MFKYVCRHGNYASQNGGLLTSEGIEQAKQLGLKLSSEHGVTPSSVEVAVSEAPRTRQTAEEAGFTNIVINPVLNELEDWQSIPNIIELLKEGRVPDEALKAARLILDYPPKQDVWVSHGFVIAGLCELQGVRQDDQLIPLECELRQIPIS